MSGQAHWLPLAVLFLAAIPVVYVFLRNRREEKKFKVELHHVRCRARGNQLFECLVVRDVKSGEPIGIRDCAGWSAGGGSHCDQTCLPLFARRETSEVRP